MYVFIYLAAPGLSCSIQDLGSLAAGRKLLVEACGIQLLKQEGNPIPSIGSAES